MQACTFPEASYIIILGYIGTDGMTIPCALRRGVQVPLTAQNFLSKVSSVLTCHCLLELALQAGFCTGIKTFLVSMRSYCWLAIAIDRSRQSPCHAV